VTSPFYVKFTDELVGRPSHPRMEQFHVPDAIAASRVQGFSTAFFGQSNRAIWCSKADVLAPLSLTRFECGRAWVISHFIEASRIPPAVKGHRIRISERILARYVERALSPLQRGARSFGPRNVYRWRIAGCYRLERPVGCLSGRDFELHAFGGSIYR
jgi:hypothetical protein